jgi:hypothetical protein
MVGRRIAVATGLFVTTTAIAVSAGAGVAKTHAGQSDKGTAYASINRVVNNVQYVSAMCPTNFWARVRLLQRSR